MRTNKWKTIWIVSFCFVIALCSRSQAMDNSLNLEEQISQEGKSRLSITNVGEEVHGLAASSLEGSLDARQDSQFSWTSYLAYSAKTIIQAPFNAISYTLRNPQKSLIIGLYLACQITTVAAGNWCECYCSKWENSNRVEKYYGRVQFADDLRCSKNCDLIGYSNYRIGSCDQDL